MGGGGERKREREREEENIQRILQGKYQSHSS